jgi:4-hydroxy-3-methylbut-2-enyl diphosphate reductase
MQILLAEHSGFCFGVERAIKIVEDTANSKENVFTLGPIIHNPQVVESLNDKGVNVADDIDNIDKCKTVIVRSHGIPKQKFNKLTQKTPNIVDATCPFVKKAHKAADTLDDDDYKIVILGEKDHPEVEGIVSYVKGKYYIVSNEEDVKQLPMIDKCGLIAQTTQNKEVFNKVKAELKKKTNELKVINTICNATTLRQETAKILAKQVDLMLVIGGKNSANTTRLYKICSEICINTYHIETKAEIEDSFFDDNIEKVGITAGASTPKYLIDEVIEYIKEVDHARKHISK